MTLSRLPAWLDGPDVEPDAFAYHYTTTFGAAIMLENWQLRMGRYEDMNDPREAKEWVADSLALPAGGVGLASLAAQHEVDDEVDRVLHRAARLACFTRDGSDPGDGTLFHRGWARSALWDRYAEKHKGACFVFDLAAVAEAVNEAVPLRDGNIFAVGNVEYRDEPLSIPLDGAYGSREEVREALSDRAVSGKAIGDLYLVKNTDWASEREWRIVSLLWDVEDALISQPLYVPFRDSLVAVVLGEGHPSPRLLQDAVVGRRSGPPQFARCTWRAGAPRLEGV